MFDEKTFNETVFDQTTFDEMAFDEMALDGTSFDEMSEESSFSEEATTSSTTSGLSAQQDIPLPKLMSLQHARAHCWRMRSRRFRSRREKLFSPCPFVLPKDTSRFPSVPFSGLCGVAGRAAGVEPESALSLLSFYFGDYVLGGSSASPRCPPRRDEKSS